MASAASAAVAVTVPIQGNDGIPERVVVEPSLKLEIPTPLFLAKANLTDPSPFCRHLMLLTESSAALRLLFECRLLQRDRTVVLVGSQFPRDANSELRMIRQINEVKRAMQSGHTVVLVNHEGIFPSLYDVLNMRYTTKRSADTGKVTRMLRLAVGNRSQWCAVGDGFKIVVIVETKDAYEKLDLPLLNRFEKQVLRSEDVLEDASSKDMWRNLKTWVSKVEQVTRVKGPFIGLYPQTLASLVHYKRLQLEVVGKKFDSSCFEMLKQELATLLSPLARIRADALSKTTTTTAKEEEKSMVITTSIEEQEGAANQEGKEEEDESSHEDEEIDFSVPESNTSRDIFKEIDSCLNLRQHLLVLTFSSSHDFELLLRKHRKEEESHETIVLGGVTSEREFSQALKRIRGRVKFVQCDPNTTPQETIEHARYLTMQELGVDEIGVFIIHLPPGGKKKRTYNVDFQARWKVLFLDDLVRPDFMSLVMTSPLGWADKQDEQVLNTSRTIRKKVGIALAQARPPLQATGGVGGGMSARERVQQTLQFLNEPVFSEMVLDGTVREILGMVRPDEHVEMVARGVVRAGTIADSLVLALETLVIRAFSLALRWFDINFNLSLLLPDRPKDIRDLWIMLASSPSQEFLLANMHQQQQDFGVETISAAAFIKNYGRPGYPVVSQFPWSWRVYETFEQALKASTSGSTGGQGAAADDPTSATESSSSVSMNGGKPVVRMIEGLAETVFGEKFLLLANKYCEEYLQDICGFQANSRTEIDLKEQTRIVKSWLERKDPAVMSSIATLHYLFADKENWALFSLLSIRCALTGLDFPQGKMLDGVENKIIAPICEFLLSAESLAHPRWLETVGQIAPHVHEAFLREEGNETCRMWTDVRFRHAYSHCMSCPPSAAPKSLLKFTSSPLTFASPPEQFRFNKYLERIAQDVVAKSWFFDEKFTLEMILFCEEEDNHRSIRLNFLRAILCHSPLQPFLGETAFDRMSSSLNIFSLALDLAEDIPTLSFVAENVDALSNNGRYTPLERAQHAALTRKSIRDFVCGRGIMRNAQNQEQEDDDELKDMVASLPSDISARAFGLNELFAKFGDLATVHKIKQDKALLLFFQAQSKYLDLFSSTKSTSASQKVASLATTIEDMQRMNCFSLLVGDHLIREAVDILAQHSEYKQLNTENGATDPAQLESRRDHLKRCYDQFFDKLQKVITTSMTRTQLWGVSVTRNLVTQKSYGLFLLCLIMATVGKVISEHKSLTDSGIADFLHDLIHLSDWAWKQPHGSTATATQQAVSQMDRKLLAYYARLACAKVDEPVWRQMFYEGNCTDSDKFLMLFAIFSVLLNEFDGATPANSPSSVLVDLMRGRSDVLKNKYLPGMEESEMSELNAALGYVGWWQCPNGHRYAVGECTMPMQKGKCFECGAVVGGMDHTPVNGVRRLDENEATGSPGYMPVQSFSGWGAGLTTKRNGLNAGAVALFQYIYHAVIVIGLQGPFAVGIRTFMLEAPSSMVTGPRRPSGASLGLRAETLMRNAWKYYSSVVLPVFCSQLDNELFFAGLCALMAREKRVFSPTSSATSEMINGAARARSEMDMAQVYRASGAELHQIVVTKIEEIQNLLGAQSNRLELTSLVSNQVFNESEMLMKPLVTSKEKTLERISFSYRVQVDFSDLLHQLEPQRESFPFLAKFCEIECNLSKVTKLADIMEWVHVLQEMLQKFGRRITREDASKITNSHIIEQVYPFGHAKHDSTYQKLIAFCQAFNDTFVLVPNLYECQRNPFLTEELSPRVDLSGSKGANGKRQEMSFDTPISFSLSAIVQGDADAASLCLFQLVRTLQQLNNTILEQLIAEDLAGRLRYNPHRNNDDDGHDHGGEDAGRRIRSEIGVDSPVTTMSTPREIILARMIDYNRKRDLLPILACSSGRATGLGKGQSRGIDLPSCEDALKRSLVSGKSPLLIVLPSFEFAGEARRSGTLAALKSRIPQCQPNKSIMFSIAPDLDTDSRIQPLAELVDSAIGFLSGFSGFDGDTLLGDFAKNVLGLDEAKWEEIAPSTVQQHIRLCHLVAMFTFLEEAKNGSPLDRVHERYAKPLPSGMEGELRMAAAKLELEVLLPILKDLLVSRLTEDTFPEDAPLADYLEYSTDLDLNALPWFVHFPQDLILAYSLNAWKVLMDCSD